MSGRRLRASASGARGDDQLSPSGWRAHGTRKRYAFCSKCVGEKQARRIGKLWRCLDCGTEVEPPRGAGRADFRNVPKESIAGRLHQSSSEADHASVILALRNAGAIENVRGLDRGDPQERFRLDVPSMAAVDALIDHVENGNKSADDIDEFFEIAERLVRDIRRSMIHVADYLADFSYTSLNAHVAPVGSRVVDDVKGWRNPRMSDAYRRFLMKKALMLACYGLEVREIIVARKGKSR